MRSGRGPSTHGPKRRWIQMQTEERYAPQCVECGSARSLGVTEEVGQDCESTVELPNRQHMCEASRMNLKGAHRLREHASEHARTAYKHEHTRTCEHSHACMHARRPATACGLHALMRTWTHRDPHSLIPCPPPRAREDVQRLLWRPVEAAAVLHCVSAAMLGWAHTAQGRPGACC